MVKKAHSNIFLEIMMMMIPLDLYAYIFFKQLGILSTLKVIRQCLLRLMITDC